MEIGQHGVNLVSVVRHVEVEVSPDHEDVRTQNHKARENHAMAKVKTANPVTPIIVQVSKLSVLPSIKVTNGCRK